jgi:hypothetical protein
MDGPEPQTWFNLAGTAIAGLLGLLASVFRGQMNRQAQDIQALEVRTAEFVTREELQKYLDQIRGDRIQMHVENLGRLDRIDDAVIRLHNRVDGVLNK